MLLVCNVFFYASSTGNLLHNTSLLYQYVQWNPLCTHTHPWQLMRSVFPYTSCLVAYFPISLNTWLDWRKFQFVLWGLSYEDLPITQLSIEYLWVLLAIQFLWGHAHLTHEVCVCVPYLRGPTLLLRKQKKEKPVWLLVCLSLYIVKKFASRGERSGKMVPDPYNHLLITQVRLPYLFSPQWLLWAVCTLFIFYIIIHQTHYEKSDWSRAFNQFTIACELDMINAISAADIVFIMSSSTSAWLPSPLECSPQKQKQRLSMNVIKIFLF